MKRPSRRSRGISRISQSLLTIGTLVVAGTVLLTLPAARANDSDDGRWLATWGAGSQSAVEALIGPPPAPVEFDNQTIRMIARISRGGDRVRVRLDNTFGTDTLVIGSAHIALHGSGPGIIGATDRVLAFGGSPTIDIPPGAPALSDPVDLKVSDLAEVAVSIYLPDPTAGESVHLVGRQTAYISQTGDFTGALTISAPTTTEARFFLSGLEVAGGLAGGSGPAGDDANLFGDALRDALDPKLRDR